MRLLGVVAQSGENLSDNDGGQGTHRDWDTEQITDNGFQPTNRQAFTWDNGAICDNNHISRLRSSPPAHPIFPSPNCDLCSYISSHAFSPRNIRADKQAPLFFLFLQCIRTLMACLVISIFHFCLDHVYLWAEGLFQWYDDVEVDRKVILRNTRRTQSLSLTSCVVLVIKELISHKLFFHGLFE